MRTLAKSSLVLNYRAHFDAEETRCLWYVRNSFSEVVKGKFVSVKIWAGVSEPIRYLNQNFGVHVALEKSSDGVAAVNFPVMNSGDGKKNFENGDVRDVGVGVGVVTTADQ